MVYQLKAYAELKAGVEKAEELLRVKYPKGLPDNREPQVKAVKVAMLLLDKQIEQEKQEKEEKKVEDKGKDKSKDKDKERALILTGFVTILIDEISKTDNDNSLYLQKLKLALGVWDEAAKPTANEMDSLSEVACIKAANRFIVSHTFKDGEERNPMLTSHPFSSIANFDILSFVKRGNAMIFQNSNKHITSASIERTDRISKEEEARRKEEAKKNPQSYLNSIKGALSFGLMGGSSKKELKGEEFEDSEEEEITPTGAPGK